MATRKSDSTGRKTTSSRKRTSISAKRSFSRRRTSRNKVDKSRLSLFLGVIFLAACVFVAINVLSTTGKQNQKTQEPKNKTEIAAAPKKTAETPKKPAAAGKPGSKNTAAATKKTAENSTKKTPAAASKPAASIKPAAAAKSTAAVPAPSKSTAPAASPAPVIVASAKGDKSGAETSSGAAVPPSSPSAEKSPFNIPAAVNGAKIVIIIDDAGLNVEYTKRYTSLPFPITIAVLPKLAHSKDCAYVVRSAGKELILHQPMQSLNHNMDPGPGKITCDMSFAQISGIVNENLKEIGPGVKGLNNHEGSEVTEDVLRIGAVLDVCQENHIYFLDSRTTANTKAPQAALERDMQIYEKAGPYIDNVVSREAMLSEMYKALDFANKNGKAIIIGHVDKSANILPKLLQDMYPYLKKAGYQFATPSTL